LGIGRGNYAQSKGVQNERFPSCTGARSSHCVALGQGIPARRISMKKGAGTGGERHQGGMGKPHGLRPGPGRSWRLKPSTEGPLATFRSDLRPPRKEGSVHELKYFAGITPRKKKEPSQKKREGKNATSMEGSR